MPVGAGKLMIDEERHAARLGTGAEVVFRDKPFGRGLDEGSLLGRPN
ncbi:hypothetical protein [Mesorhizobium sp. M7A.F.Ca.US.005.03.1.1]|nr:hypothetical protein [Mesorhizobium sp. M7A.F.Ca.US.005.03.1.1]